MKNFIRDYFTFNKRERNGVFVLLSIITILIVWFSISNKFIESEQTDFSKFESEIEKFNLAIQSSKDSAVSNQKNIQTNFEKTKLAKTKPEIELFEFDPNNLSDENWKKLGLSNKQILTIRNYENKGGKFKVKEDFKKMYCISAKQYAQLEDYIKIKAVIKEQTDEHLNKSVFTNKGVVSILELNSVDSIQLIKLKGIGGYFANKIIKYRNLLGGFFEKEQLMEVWNLNGEKYNEIQEYVTIDISKVKKININSCTVQELKHPYLKWNQINAIVNYREKHGKYKAVDEIKRTDLVDDETLRKIAPYLTVD